jgi:hypothetical protein
MKKRRSKVRNRNEHRTRHFPSGPVSMKICCICGAKMPIFKCRRHLITRHKLIDVVVSDFFTSMSKSDPKPQHESWYRPDDIEPDIPCGTKIHGAPFAKIIYNPVATNRRRH